MHAIHSIADNIIISWLGQLLSNNDQRCARCDSRYLILFAGRLDDDFKYWNRFDIATDESTDLEIPNSIEESFHILHSWRNSRASNGMSDSLHRASRGGFLDRVRRESFYQKTIPGTRRIGPGEHVTRQRGSRNN